MLYQLLFLTDSLAELSQSPSEVVIIFSPSFTNKATKVLSRDVVELGFKWPSKSDYAPSSVIPSFSFVWTAQAVVPSLLHSCGSRQSTPPKTVKGSPSLT